MAKLPAALGLGCALISIGAGTAPRLEPANTAAVTFACRQPQLAADGDAVYLACGEGGTIFVAASADGGRTFGPLRTVDTVPSLALGAHRGPRIAIAGSTLVVSAVVAKIGGGKDGNLVAWRSTDRGRTWGAPVVINDAPESAREGLHAMAARGNAVAAAWLDLRAKGTRLYAATSKDAGRTWSANIPAYQSPSGTICQCCHPSLAIGEDGRTFVMFRNDVAGHRDLYLADSTGGAFTAAQKLGNGTWPLEACPMDGGGLAIDADGRLVSVWRRQQTIYLDSPGQPEVAVGPGVNPAVAATPAGPIIAWTSEEGLVMASPNRQAVVLDKAGRFPSLTRSADATVAAWERGTQVVVRVIQDVREPSASAPAASQSSASRRP